VESAKQQPLDAIAAPEHDLAFVRRLRERGEKAGGAARVRGYDESYGPIPEHAWMREGGLEPAIVARCSSIRGLTAAAAAGAGIAMLPVNQATRAHLIELPTPRPIPARALYLVTHPQARAWPALRRVVTWVFATFVAEAKAQNART
jgi:DNA-binding transcriptional LysR family regulator